MELHSEYSMVYFFVLILILDSCYITVAKKDDKVWTHVKEIANTKLIVSANDTVGMYHLVSR